MSTRSLKNIALRDFQRFLESEGCKLIRTKGGHMQYARPDLFRPITLQTHIDPIPEFIVRNCLRILGMSKEEFFRKFNS